MVRYLMRMPCVYSGTYPTEVAKGTRKRRQKTNKKEERKLAKPATNQLAGPPAGRTGSRAGYGDASRKLTGDVYRTLFRLEPEPVLPAEAPAQPD